MTYLVSQGREFLHHSEARGARADDGNLLLRHGGLVQAVRAVAGDRHGCKEAWPLLGKMSQVGGDVGMGGRWRGVVWSAAPRMGCVLLDCVMVPILVQQKAEWKMIRSLIKI